MIMKCIIGCGESAFCCSNFFSNTSEMFLDLLTVPQKKDLLRHVISMAASNKALRATRGEAGHV